ncbi:Ubiquitin-conjugating enzyme E2 J1 [Smittium culicis]|uniref:Ubiquitin-conjugating enzyme E2 J1 n=1 Tax=Smittium culicis TaxID=133412 RepID=A0A1R1X299_9FUNG|nr:Ubiquitin-conjugating enzyme E2 J1 [Smittium culicis]
MQQTSNHSSSSISYNMRSPAVRRLLREYKDIEKEPSPLYRAAPTEQDIFIWHFTIRGSSDSAYSTGKYHGKILFSADYPFKPPSIVFMTPNGRFETNKKICLSFTDYHPESWQPSWGIQTVLIALISFLPIPSRGAIGSLTLPDEEVKRLAALSSSYVCPECSVSLSEILNEPITADNQTISEEIKSSVDILIHTASTIDFSDKKESGNNNISPINELVTSEFACSDLNASDTSSETVEPHAQGMIKSTAYKALQDSISPQTTTNINHTPNVLAQPTLNINSNVGLQQPNNGGNNLLLLDFCIALLSIAIAYLVFFKLA